MKLLCIYHGNCADGFGAAWVVRRALGKENVEFYPGVYQTPPPDVTGRNVIIVDFSYKRDVLMQLAERAETLLVLDHHKTAAEDLAYLPRIGSLADWRQRPIDEHVGALFDMERSGAGLTWDFFNPGAPRPALIDHIEDRDLWRFALPHTREIQAALFSYPYDFDVWDKLIEVAQFEPMHLVNEGQAIERKHRKDIAELLQVVTRPMRFLIPAGLGHPEPLYVTVPAANLPYTMTSDAGHLLCGCSLRGVPDAAVKHPFAGCYWDTPEGRVFSLRSRGDGADVGAIAKLYGGGGHAHAAGFKVSYDRLKEFEV